jgi:hypothetical protein
VNVHVLAMPVCLAASGMAACFSTAMLGTAIVDFLLLPGTGSNA